MVRGIFRAMAKWYLDDHNVDIEFQGFSKEVAGLPGAYSAPSEGLFIAFDEHGAAIGAIAIRKFDEQTCEVKRLFVRPSGRGSGAGNALATAAVQGAKALGYKRAVLDTAWFMKAAQKIYEAQGFKDIAPYYDNPYAARPGAVRFMGLDL